MKEKVNLRDLLILELDFYGGLSFVENGRRVYIRKKAPRIRITQPILEDLLEIADQYHLYVCLDTKGLCVCYATEEDEI